MKFSVVITTYNRLDLLKRAINSALLQTLECEVVVADDCSSDGTADYVKSFREQLPSEQQQRLVYICNKTNSGHAATVNAGISQAKGEWIKFLDDDDYLASNCLEEMHSAIALCENAVIVSCVASQVSELEVEISRTPVLGPGEAFYIPQADIHYGMLLERLPFGTPVQVACTREAFLRSGGWDIKLTGCDDIDSWIRIAQFGDAIFLNQCLAYRTIWSGGYDQKIFLKKRLNTNISMKEKIYALVDEQHRSEIPDLEDIKGYLKLHWALVALKQKKVKNFLKLADVSVLSLTAWRLLLASALARRGNTNSPHLRKIVLIESSKKN
ncbi:glycosyl transferase family protein [Calothrix parasitica NIES-267]|uniref:Glycosyl transferase family protein n=1 Tax=Calothrix parasitica NIES-267 TaxID=1973488 RepID=A0A1Z4LWF9_9CYAN|nr:glycosyl transferase family protein [Calothrix parasitica NIES-267]